MGFGEIGFAAGITVATWDFVSSRVRFNDGLLWGRWRLCC